MVPVVARGRQADEPDMGQVHTRLGCDEIRGRNVDILPDRRRSGDISIQRTLGALDNDIHVPGVVGRDGAPFQAQVHGRIGAGAQEIEGIAADLEKHIPVSAGRVDGIEHQSLRAADVVHGHGATDIPYHGTSTLVYRRAPPAPVGRVLIRIEVLDGRQGELGGKGGDGQQHGGEYTEQPKVRFQNRVWHATKT